MILLVNDRSQQELTQSGLRTLDFGCMPLVTVFQGILREVTPSDLVGLASERRLVCHTSGLSSQRVVFPLESRVF